MSKGKKKRKVKRERKRIEAYKRTGKKLKPVLVSYANVMCIDYHRQLLPQLLWLESLLDYYGDKRFLAAANEFLDLVDTLETTGSEPVSGLVESFSFVPEPQRRSFVNSNKSAVQDAVIVPFGAALCLYTECPMHWILACYGELENDFDLDSTLASLKRWTASLLDRCGEHASLTRTMVFARYFNAGKFPIRDPELLDELKTYPECKNRSQTESKIRAMSNALFGQVVQGFSWGDAFWETNGGITICTTGTHEGQDVGEEGQDELLSTLIPLYDEGARAFLTSIRADHIKCMPDPNAFEKTSVLSGLLARASALSLDMLTERSLWVGEIGGIMLRCLCETLVLLAWLLHKDEDELYRQFVQYSLGQQDLYGLKLQDYEGYRQAFKSLYLGDDKTANALSRDSWEAQLRTIELGNWASTDTRKMAEEGGTKRYYDVVFSLYSADVHSQFLSIARWNMTVCTNPLHNCHLLPAFGLRLCNPFLPLTACVLLREVCQRFFTHYNIDAVCTDVLSQLLVKASALTLNASSASSENDAAS